MNAENQTDETQPRAEILPEQLGLESRFKFKCHKGVSCFTECCRGIDIMLTPYDILTIRKKLDIDSEKFLSIFTTPQLLEKADMPVKFLLRDENLVLMDQYLTNGKSRTIPIMIFINEYSNI